MFINSDNVSTAFAGRITTSYNKESDFNLKSNEVHTQSFLKELQRDIKNLSHAMASAKLNSQHLEWHVNKNSDNSESYDISYRIGDYEYSVTHSDNNEHTKDEALSSESQYVVAKSDRYGGKNMLLMLDSAIDANGNRIRPFMHSMTETVSADSGFDFNPYRQESSVFSEEFSIQDDKGYSYSDVINNLKKLESLLDKHLVAEYEKNPKSEKARQLLFLKSKLETFPETLKQAKQLTLNNITSDIMGSKDEEAQVLFSKVNHSVDKYQAIWQREAGLLTEFALNLKDLLGKEEQQELVDSLNVILNFADHRSHEMLDDKQIDQSAIALRLQEAIEQQQQKLKSQFAAIDNTSILLGLSADSHPSSTHNESKQGIESLFTQIKKARHSDSILREAMALKENNDIQDTQSR